MAHLLRLTATLLVSTLVACGGKSLDESGAEPGDGGSSSQGGSSSTAGRGGKSPSGGAAQGGSSAGQSASGSGQGGRAPDVCDDFGDGPATTIGVEIVNQTSTRIYFGSETAGCSPAPVLEIQDAAGTQLVIDAYCRASCDVVRKEGPVACPAICASPTATALEPGQSLSTSWNAQRFVEVEMPKQCVVGPYGVANCVQAQAIQPGTYVFSARAGSEITCDGWTASGVCEACHPGSSGGCVTNGGLIGGDVRSASTSVLLDTNFGIYPRAAPAPGSEPPLFPAPLPIVQIVFTD